MRLLLAEDEHSLSKALITILERNHYSADPAYNGREALEYLETGNYDAVILDIMMPGPMITLRSPSLPGSFWPGSVL